MFRMEFAGNSNLTWVGSLPRDRKMIGCRYNGILEGIEGIKCQVRPINRVMARDLDTGELLAR